MKGTSFSNGGSSQASTKFLKVIFINVEAVIEPGVGILVPYELLSLDSSENKAFNNFNEQSIKK